MGSESFKYRVLGLSLVNTVVDCKLVIKSINYLTVLLTLLVCLNGTADKMLHRLLFNRGTLRRLKGNKIWRSLGENIHSRSTGINSKGKKHNSNSLSSFLSLFLSNRIRATLVPDVFSFLYLNLILASFASVEERRKKPSGTRIDLRCSWLEQPAIVLI